jgi:hypothetical protein
MKITNYKTYKIFSRPNATKSNSQRIMTGRFTVFLIAILTIVTVSIGCNTKKPDNDIRDAAMLSLLFNPFAFNNSTMVSHLNVDLKTIKSLAISSSVTGNANSSSTRPLIGQNVVVNSGQQKTLSSGPLLSAKTVSSGEGSKIYAITSTGSTEEVVIFNDTYTVYYYPVHIENLKNYVIFAFDGYGAPCNVVIGRKSDNALFCPHDPNANEKLYVFRNYDWSNGISYDGVFKTDAQENIYINGYMLDLTTYSNFNSSIFKVDLSSLSNPTMTTIVDGEYFGYISKYSVHPSGHVIFESYRDYMTHVFGFKKADGSLGDLLSYLPPAWIGSSWIDVIWGLSPEGELYSFSPNDWNNLDPTKKGKDILKIQLDNNPVNTINFPVETSAGDWTNYDIYINSWDNRVNCNTNNYAVWGALATNYVYPNEKLASLILLDWTNQNGDIVKFDTSGDEITSLNKIVCSDSDVFALAHVSSLNDTIFRFKTTDKTHTKLVDGGYLINAMDYSKDTGTLTFSGLEVASGDKVVAEVYPAVSNAVHIISRNSPDIIQLVPIN